MWKLYQRGQTEAIHWNINHIFHFVYSCSSTLSAAWRQDFGIMYCAYFFMTMGWHQAFSSVDSVLVSFPTDVKLFQKCGWAMRCRSHQLFTLTTQKPSLGRAVCAASFPTLFLSRRHQLGMTAISQWYQPASVAWHISGTHGRQAVVAESLSAHSKIGSSFAHSDAYPHKGSGCWAPVSPCAHPLLPGFSLPCIILPDW